MMAILEIRRREGCTPPLGIDEEHIQENGHGLLAVGMGPDSRRWDNDAYSFGLNTALCDPYHPNKEAYFILDMKEIHNFYGLDREYIHLVIRKLVLAAR